MAKNLKWGERQLAPLGILATTVLGAALLSGCSLNQSNASIDSTMAPNAIEFDPPLNSTFSIDQDEIFLVTPNNK